MTTIFAANYDGLRQKSTYEELVGLVESGGPGLAQPDRKAKQLRETPQIANLLDGDGLLSFVELQKQSAAAAAHQRVEVGVREAAAESGSSAQELRAAATQTMGPRTSTARTQTPAADTGARSTQTSSASVADAATQDWRAQIRSGGTQTDGSPSPASPAFRTPASAPEMFDLTADDRMDVSAQDLDAALDALGGQAQATSAAQRANLEAMISHHLGEEVSRAQQDFAHRMATATAAPPGQPGQPASPTRPPTKNKAEGSPAPRAKSKARQGGSPPDPPPRPARKAAAKRAPAEDGDEPEVTGAASSSSAAPPGPSGGSAGPARGRGDPEVAAGELIIGKSRAWWKKQPIRVLREQAELRDRSFTDEELNGSRVRKKGRMVGTPKLKQEEYFAILWDLLG